MTKILTILFFLIALVSNATVYYIDNGGSNSADGSVGTPWETLEYALTQVSSGDEIHVNAGTYNISTQVNVPVGVSITGDGDGSHLVLTYQGASTSAGCLNLTSASQGTNGNQTISYLKIDGSSLTGRSAITVYRRSNVKIHHCTIVDFYYTGVTFQGNTDGTIPSTFATGNEFYNNIVTNCSYVNSGSFYAGLLRMGGQDGLLVHDNTFTQSGRTLATNGDNLTSRWLKNLKFYNNISNRDEAEVTLGNWDFHWEAFDGLGGNMVYGNTFTGTSQQIDLAGWYEVSGDSTFSWKFYDNTFQLLSKYTKSSGYANTIGIDIEVMETGTGVPNEGVIEGVYIYRNKFINMPQSIQITQTAGTTSITDVHIYYNVFQNCGYTNHAYDFTFIVSTSQVTGTSKKIYFDNNTAVGGSGDAGNWSMVYFDVTGPADSIFIRNNILENSTQSPIWNNGGTIGSLFNQNNIFYNTGNSDLIDNDGTITNYVNTNNQLNTDPDYISSTNYALNETSPAINAGLNLGYTTDFSGNLIIDLPDIGAHEYGGEPPVTPPATSGTPISDSNGKYLIDSNGNLIIQ